MKAIVCEMCGGNDLLKKDGMYVCQNCGTKYSIEEAKKLMVEGTVDVSGSTVRVDESDKTKNYMMLANNAYESNNKKEAESYCNKVIETEPNNYEAWLLKGKSAGWQSTMAELRIDEAVNAFQKAIDSAPEDKVEEVKKDASNEVSSLCNALVSLACEHYAKYGSLTEASQILAGIKVMKQVCINFLIKCKADVKDTSAQIASKINSSTVNAFKKMWADYQGSNGYPSDHAWNEFIKRVNAAIVLLETAITLSNDDDAQDIQAYKNLIFLTDKLKNAKSYSYSAQIGGYITNKSFNQAYRTQLTDKIMEYHQKIKELDPNYVIPNRPADKSGCYVATCVYGSYDCPEVWTLRRYRDYKLAETWYGKCFICLYYAVSPTIVKLFGQTKTFKKMFKKKLDKMVSNLNEKGYESTPYEDKEWK